MLTQTPDTSIAVLVRRKGSASGVDRITTVLAKDDLHRGGRGGRRRGPAHRVSAAGRRGRPRRRTGPPQRHLGGRALRGRRLLRPAGRPGVHDQHHRHPQPARAGRGAWPARALRPHLDGVRRRTAQRVHPRGLGRPQRRPRGRARVGPGAARRDREPLSYRRPPGPPPRGGREGARPGRADHRRIGDGGEASRVGARRSWSAPAPSAPGASAGPTATRSPRRSASGSSRRTP